MPVLLAGTIEIVHIEQVSALFTFRLGQVLLYNVVFFSSSYFTLNYLHSPESHNWSPMVDCAMFYRIRLKAINILFAKIDDYFNFLATERPSSFTLQCNIFVLSKKYCKILFQIQFYIASQTKVF
jgi:hypothetical protein